MRTSHLFRFAGAALLTGLFLLAPGAGGQPPKAGEKATVLAGQLKAASHKVRLEAGKLYHGKVGGEGFTPVVRVRPGSFVKFGDKAGGQGDVFEGYVTPTETRDHSIIVALGSDDLDEMPFNYSVTVTPMVQAINQRGQLTDDDPPYKNGGVNAAHHKAFPINMKAGQMYIITLDQVGPGGFDPFLALEGPGGGVVAQNDDANGLNSRIVYQPRRGGEHRVVASGLGGGVGRFHLQVITAAAGVKAGPSGDPPTGGAPRKGDRN